MCEGDSVMIEDFVDGLFEKYVNNNEEICGDKNKIIAKKLNAFHITLM